MANHITVAHGDGIGPEIMDATLSVLEAAKVSLHYDRIDIGEKQFLAGHETGISAASWNTILKNPVFLKSPITTPQGGGYKSLNVTIRKSLGLFANVRPCRAFMPYVHGNFPDLDLVIVRENEEDLYAGIEHQQTQEVFQSLKLISRPGTEKIVRYAFEYARVNHRHKITCMTKDNIMKLTDGLFHKVFDEVAKEYPGIEANHMIIDIGSAKLAHHPDQFDVIVTLNLYGDIISDIAAEVAGSVGLGGSSNVGMKYAMFEAIHGSAPDIAGKNIANPSGLINGAIMMLNHMDLTEEAAKIHNAWLCTIEQGIHTGDIYKKELSSQKVGTKEFAQAVIENLGNRPSQMKPVDYGKESKPISIQLKTEKIHQKKELVGVDVFLDWSVGNRNPDELGKLLEACQSDAVQLKLVSNRGVRVYPGGVNEFSCSDHWRCRFVSSQSTLNANRYVTKFHALEALEIPKLLERLFAAGLDTVKTENLYTFDGKRGYTLGQGE